MSTKSRPPAAPLEAPDLATTDLHRLMLEGLPISAYMKDAEGRYVAVNERTAHFFGFPANTLVGRKDAEVFDTQLAAQLSHGDDVHPSQGQPFVKEIALKHPTGERHLLIHKQAVQVDNANYVIGASVDITSRKKAEQLLSDERAILAMVACGTDLHETLDSICLSIQKHLPGCRASIMLLDAEGLHLRHGAAPGLDPALVRFLDGMEIGLSQMSCGTAAFTRQPVFATNTAKHPGWTAFQSIRTQFDIAASYAMPVLATNGRVLGTIALYLKEAGDPHPQTTELIQHMCSITSIALERAQATDRLHQLATTDVLTQVPNRRHFLSMATREIARATRNGHPVTLCMLDIDHFKRVNDEHGHATGDTALRQVAQTIAKSLRNTDLCGRLGGEEFAVLLPETSLLSAVHVAERIRQEVAATPISNAEGEALHITTSIGLCALQANETLEQLMSRADKALYTAKETGRNKTVSTA